MTERCTIAGKDACTLSPDELRVRLAWIDELNAAGLRSRRRVGDGVELTYEPAVAGQVRELVRRERDCCRFLELHVREAADSVVLSVSAPGRSAAWLEALAGGQG